MHARMCSLVWPTLANGQCIYQPRIELPEYGCLHKYASSVTGRWVTQAHHHKHLCKHELASCSCSSTIIMCIDASVTNIVCVRVKHQLWLALYTRALQLIAFLLHKLASRSVPNGNYEPRCKPRPLIEILR